MRKNQTPAGKLGVDFAMALVGGDFQAGNSMLSSALKLTLTPDVLKQSFEKMTARPKPWTANNVELFESDDEGDDDDEDCTDFAYVSIDDGKSFAEGVSVTTEDENGNSVICRIEWGRP